MNKDLEQQEIDLLLDKGFEVKIKIFGIEKTFRTLTMSAYRMIELADEFIKMQIDEKALYSEDFQEQISAQYQAVSLNGKRIGKIIAICLSDNAIIRKLIARQVLKTYTSKDLLDFTQKTHQTSRLRKFHRLYCIDERKQDNPSDHSREIKSIYGIIGQICHHYGWTIDYTLKVPDWRIIQRMLIDSPKYEDDKGNEVLDLTEQSADEIEAMLGGFM